MLSGMSDLYSEIFETSSGVYREHERKYGSGCAKRNQSQGRSPLGTQNQGCFPIGLPVASFSLTLYDEIIQPKSSYYHQHFIFFKIAFFSNFLNLFGICKFRICFELVNLKFVSN